MAVPKRKTNRARRDKRRTHWTIAAPTLAACSHCGQVVTSHRVCGNCGFYGGVEIRVPEED